MRIFSAAIFRGPFRDVAGISFYLFIGAVVHRKLTVFVGEFFLASILHSQSNREIPE